MKASAKTAFFKRFHRRMLTCAASAQKAMQVYEDILQSTSMDSKLYVCTQAKRTIADLYSVASSPQNNKKTRRPLTIHSEPPLRLSHRVVLDCWRHRWC